LSYGVPPTRVARSVWATIAYPAVSKALRRDLPLTERLHALELLLPIIDQLLETSWFRRGLESSIRGVVGYLRGMGYHVEQPGRGDDDVWLREQLYRCMDDEDLLSCLERRVRIAARILAIAAFLTPADYEPAQALAEELGL
jgi:hypothetical protein